MDELVTPHAHDWRAEYSYAGTTLERCPCGLTRYVTHRNGEVVIGQPYQPKVKDYEQYR